jgi:hypothetical protein
VRAAHGQVIGADNIFFTKSAVLAIDPYPFPSVRKTDAILLQQHPAEQFSLMNPDSIGVVPRTATDYVT